MGTWRLGGILAARVSLGGLKEEKWRLVSLAKTKERKAASIPVKSWREMRKNRVNQNDTKLSG